MSAMRGYERDEYEDLDEYEEDGEEQDHEEGDEDEFEEDEVHQPTQEELEYLELRKRLKESIRKKMKKELGTVNCGSRDKMNASRKDNYGSFFGPSQPVIAQRVIQESKSLLENPNLAARISKPNNTNNKNSVSFNTVGSKPRPNLPKAVNVLKKKVELLKNTRDYSFLLSEDSEIPVSKKSPPRKISAPKSDARSAQQLPKSKHVVNNRGRDIVNSGDGRKHVVANGQSRPKVGSEKMAPASKLLMGSRNQLGSNYASGPGRPVGPGPKGVTSKSPVSASVNNGVNNNPIASARKPTSSLPQPGMHKPAPSNLQSGVRRPTSSHMHSSISKNSSVQRKEYQETNRQKVVPKSSLLSSRDEVKRPPSKAVARDVVADQRPKPKPGKRPFADSDDEDDPINMIHKMFRYKRSKFRDDDDDSDMEANFDDIMREEQRSARIGREEDEEQARLLEEEEKRRRMRLAKKRTMDH